MRDLELLAPARNADIGIAAIDCGADAVYIAGPDFGARKAAGNPVTEIARLCAYAHRFGARVFVTFNISLRDGEEPLMHAQMLEAQEAGADAFIIRDTAPLGWKDITVPLHASTQCAIRSVADAQRYAQAGCARIILERELPLETIRAICNAVSCEVECFVHGALCVCYSGECRLSEYLDGRSADRGDCIQACRSRYDLLDGTGKILMHDKALLSLRDLDLHGRLDDLAGAGVTSFKIEGRLKGEDYVRNLVRLYSEALDHLVETRPGACRRASFGSVEHRDFTPDPAKTFHRGYTQLFLDGVRQRGWSSMDAPSFAGEKAGTIRSIEKKGPATQLRLCLEKGIVLHNGDGFTFLCGGELTGFRGDVCSGDTLLCRAPEGLREGMTLYRNADSAFLKKLESASFRRAIAVSLDVSLSGDTLHLEAESEDGRRCEGAYRIGAEEAHNRERQEELIRSQLSKRALHYNFAVRKLRTVEGSALPLISAGTLNEMRRDMAAKLDAMPVRARKLHHPDRPGVIPAVPAGASSPLMRSKYCIRFELGLCPVHQGASDSGKLFLLNNNRRLALGFDCKACEMTVSPATFY
ncbi:MAG: U32 family peptidase [Bacteroidales bacterium]|nr:U32 family peptidase [Bacteroidales bacterium]